MHNVGREQRLADLRTRIAAIEKRPLLAEAAGLPAGGKARQRPSHELVLRAPAGLLHEVYADEQRNGGAALGFALGMARGLLTPARPAILVLQLAHEAEESGLPYGPGIGSFGLDPEQVILGRLANPAELMWAVEEAIACRAVAGVVVEVLGAPKALDFTNSRRLALRAASGGASVLLVRYGLAREASAARLRWRITPAESQAPPFDARAPGRAGWQVVLEKGRLGAGLMEVGLEFRLDWTADGFQPADRGEAAGSRRDHARPAAHGAASAELGDRVSQAG